MFFVNLVLKFKSPVKRMSYAKVDCSHLNTNAKRLRYALHNILIPRKLQNLSILWSWRYWILQLLLSCVRKHHLRNFITSDISEMFFLLTGFSDNSFSRCNDSRVECSNITDNSNASSTWRSSYRFITPSNRGLCSFNINRPTLGFLWHPKRTFADKGISWSYRFPAHYLILVLMLCLILCFYWCYVM